MSMSVFATVVVLSIAIVVGLIILYRRYYSSRARRFGYESRAAYFEAVPRTDAEKREAVDQALMGLVLCLVGLLLPPVLLVGIVPLFVGGRKAVFSALGLGLSEEIDPMAP
jgi:RsiW-degrading membrane proteinase PrsW (M82 family)